MKASLKLREEQQPLVRVKVPLHLMGMPLFTGVTSGAPHELALHIGTSSDAGPALRFSYKPNNAESPFAILVKAGLGVWGSPHGAALAMSAQVNLSSTGTPSFCIRVKPKFGDFGFRKDTRSITVAFAPTEKEGEKLKPVTMEAGPKMHEDSIRALSYDGFSSPNGSPTGVTPIGGFSVKEKIQSFTNGDAQHKDGASDTGSIEDGFTPVYDDRETRSVVDLGRTQGMVESWMGASTKGWSMSAHSALPIGDKALAKARWSMKFGSNAFQSLRDGFSVTDIRLPTLTIDKLSIEAVDPYREVVSLEAGGYGYGDGESQSQQVERIAAMCVSMRYQLQLLHSENKVLKKSVDELRAEMTTTPTKKGPVKSDRVIQEENALRMQLFDELNGKADSNPSAKSNGKSSRGKARDGSQAKEVSSLRVEPQEMSRSSGSKTSSSSSSTTDFGSSIDPVSEELKKAIMNATSG